MVEFLKSKGTSFVNKPVGVNNVNTGAVEAGQTLARVGQQLATQFFADAEKEQIKLGKEVGMTLPVRDTDGNLFFQTTPTSLSDVAKNAASPIIQKRYADALNVDIFTRINEIRNDSKTSNQFQNNVRNEMSTYIEQTKVSGGNRYVGGMTETIAKLSAQHYNAMASEEMKESMRIASLQSLQITNMSISDLISITSKEIENVAPNEVAGVIADLSEQQNSIIAQNNDNLRTNNLAVDTHTKADTKTKLAITYGLVNALTKDKTPVQILDIENYFRNGVIPEHLDEKQKVLLSEIEKSPFRQEVKKYVSSVQDKVNETAVKIESDANKEYLKKQRQFQEYANDPNIKIASANYEAQFQSRAMIIYKDIIANDGVVSEENAAKIKALDKEAFEVSSKGGKVINGQRIILSNTQRTNMLNKSVVMGMENTIIQSGEFQTSDSLENLQAAFYNQDPRLLNANQKKIYNTITNIADASLQKDVIITAVASELNNNITSRAKSDANIAYTQNIQSNMNNADGRGLKKFGNSTKEQENLDKGLDINASYFYQTFEEESNNGTNRALRIQTQMRKGNYSAAFKNFMENAIARGNDAEITRAINLFQTYSQVAEGGIRVDKLYGVLEKESYALYNIASKLIPAYRGQTSFFDVQGQGPNGVVTQGQMITKIKQVYQDRENTENASFFKSNLKRIIGKDSKNSYEYLRTKMDLGPNEARDLYFMVDMAASMGLDKDQTDQIINFAKEGIYIDGEGTVVDFFDGGSEAFRSKYSFKAIFDEEDQSYARSMIQRQLNDLEHFNEKGRSVGSFKLMFKPTQVIDGQVQYSIGQKVGTIKPDIMDTPVYLQPIAYGSRKDDVRYVAVTKKGDFYNPIRLPNGSLMSFDAKSLRRGGLGDN